MRDFTRYTAMVTAPSPRTRRQLANGKLAYLTQVLVDITLDECTGAIEVRSPATAAGYLRRPAEQATNFTGGWYRPGDLGRLDEEGHGPGR